MNYTIQSKRYILNNSDFQKILNKDTDTKTLNNSVVKLQNRLYLLEIDDANRKAKLDHIFTDAKSVYPVFKSKIEETRFTKALVGFSSWEFYEKFSTADFGEYEADITKPPAEIIESKLDTLIKSLSNLPKTRSKRNKELALVTKNYRALDKAMKIYLGALDDIAPLSDIRQTAPEKMKKKD